MSNRKVVWFSVGSHPFTRARMVLPGFLVMKKDREWILYIWWWRWVVCVGPHYADYPQRIV